MRLYTYTIKQVKGVREKGRNRSLYEIPKRKKNPVCSAWAVTFHSENIWNLHMYEQIFVNKKSCYMLFLQTSVWTNIWTKAVPAVCYFCKLSYEHRTNICDILIILCMNKYLWTKTVADSVWNFEMKLSYEQYLRTKTVAVCYYCELSYEQILVNKTVSVSYYCKLLCELKKLLFVITTKFRMIKYLWTKKVTV